jgi:3-oxoacyl-[acyl-carrier-protein] synthase II
VNVFICQPIIIKVAGYGASCDANHITSGLADGSGALLAILAALPSTAQHKLPFKDELWLVNAHATSTPRGDYAEMNAVRACLDLLRDDCLHWGISVHPDGPYVTAHKSNLGHMIGAAGAMESVFAALSLQNGVIPGVLNMDNPEEGIGDRVRILPGTLIDPKSDSGTRRLVLKNSFGFGGTNVSLVFAEYIS